MTGNVGHARGCPPTLEGVDETGIKCCSPGVEDPGGFGIDIIWEVVGLVVQQGLCGVTTRSRIGSMGFIEAASE